ncbi:Hypothetical predicted protein [Paramuricea clavata]|uniref:Uncharacterized protein n=1 Tax=Paramuricea clavata TaxID=317549 RepID=A0A7D9H929_PARCT|nr:Hypothetical predicted protein [Paramuricea clavata]
MSLNSKGVIHGQDYAIDLCGTLDVLEPVISLMLRAQAVKFPPWRIVTWFSRMIKILKVWKQTLKRCWEQTLKMETNPEEKLAKLSKHWEESTPPTRQMQCWVFSCV